jgi:hypothetical protein
VLFFSFLFDSFPRLAFFYFYAPKNHNIFSLILNIQHTSNEIVTTRAFFKDYSTVFFSNLYLNFDFFKNWPSFNEMRSNFLINLEFQNQIESLSESEDCFNTSNLFYYLLLFPYSTISKTISAFFHETDTMTVKMISLNSFMLTLNELIVLFEIMRCLFG